MGWGKGARLEEDISKKNTLRYGNIFKATCFYVEQRILSFDTIPIYAHLTHLSSSRNFFLEEITIIETRG